MKYTFDDVARLAQNDAVYLASTRYIVNRFEIKDVTGNPRIWLWHPLKRMQGYRVNENLLQSITRIVPRDKTRKHGMHKTWRTKRAA